MIKDLGSNKQKPRNYSRKNYICSCECPICDDGKIIDRFMVKYEIEPNKNIIKQSKNYGHGRWSTYSYWGKFGKVIELPSIINKMNDDEYIVKTGHFTRDNIQVPFICEIEILNIQKYNMLKTQIQRKKKLKNLNNE